jgi:hypothetical protein
LLIIVPLDDVETLHTRKGKGINVYRVLVGKPEGKRPLERPRFRRELGL